MNYGPLLFLAAFFAMATSWFSYVLLPQVQIGGLQPTNSVPSGITYPLSRPGLAREGLDVYRANGCAYCHSQQIGQTATLCDVELTDAGTNPPVLVAAMLKAQPRWSEAEAKEKITRLPATIDSGLTKDDADAQAKQLSVAGAKAQVVIRPIGPDIARAWGKRRTVADDFLYDYPVMLGDQRVGPDLANVGARLPDANWHLLHLFAPTSKVERSIMPPYPFLFEKRKIKDAPSPEALTLRGSLAPPPGFEIVPKPEAKALVAYLLNLRAETPLFYAPLTVQAQTNSQAKAGSP
jgi:cbb3-type cytochrome oxidase cytochrome c subunit